MAFTSFTMHEASVRKISIISCSVFFFKLINCHQQHSNTCYVQPTTPYVPTTCDVIPSYWTSKFRSIVDYKGTKFDPVKLQPRRSDRKYRPWSWEFQGARMWPWLNNEQYVGEELRLRHDRKMPHRRPFWNPNPPSSPCICETEAHRPPPCRAPVWTTCCTDYRPPIAGHTASPAPLKYANFVNSQWIP
jgi:hypothetical protein